MTPQQVLDLLQSRGLLSAAGLRRVREAAAAAGASPLAVLPQLGLVSEQALTEALAEVTGLPVLDRAGLLQAALDAPALSRAGLSPAWLRMATALPLSGDRLALADPLDPRAPSALGAALGRPQRLCLAMAGDILAALELIAAGLAAEGAAEGEAESELSAAGFDDVQLLKDRASEAPIIRLVSRLLDQAVALGASDIHLDPMEGALRVRMRIDGVLRVMEIVPPALAPAVLTRVKILARLDIAERRLPQDGRIRVPVGGRDLDLRVATIPQLRGEGATLRLLDQGSLRLDLAALGFGAAQAAALGAAAARSTGLVLVTGPTGSGKTSTLYALLKQRQDDRRKIMTVEDPVEYELPGIAQVQIQPGIGLDFSRVLRAVLRHDPNILMVGEIRDRETAEIAIQSALTGHLVLSTLHTNSSAGAITRLMDMGIEPFLIGSTLILASAQRLVRRLCPSCRSMAPVPASLAERLHLPPGASAGRAVGCAACRDTGYRGRLAIVELFPMSDPARALITDRASTPVLEAHRAEMAGFPDLLGDGIAKALSGETSLEEVLRIVQGGDL